MAKQIYIKASTRVSKNGKSHTVEGHIRKYNSSGKSVPNKKSGKPGKELKMTKELHASKNDAIEELVSGVKGAATKEWVLKQFQSKNHKSKQEVVNHLRKLAAGNDNMQAKLQSAESKLK